MVGGAAMRGNPVGGDVVGGTVTVGDEMVALQSLVIIQWLI